MQENEHITTINVNTVFNWKHLNDKKLYTDNNYAIESLKNGINLNQNGFDSKTEANSIHTFHCYWFGTIARKQILSLKSFLCTQNMRKCRVILWLDIDNGYKDYEENGLIKQISPFIEIKAYDPLQEILNTPWENHINLANYTNGYSDLVKRGDAFRFLILYKYGGTYFDLDILFLQDLSALLHTEFCYAWERQPFANSAIFNIRAGSAISSYLLQKCITKQAVSPPLIFRYNDEGLKDLYILPCAFFDPIWQGLPSESSPFVEFQEFFQPFDEDFTNKFNIQSYKDFFPGCYAYHWHNEWNTAEYENSFFGIFEREFNQLLDKK